MMTIGGLPGTGTTTVSRILSARLGLRHVYVGQIFREMASERGMTVEEFNSFVEDHLDIDRELDARQVAIAREGGIILEGRMSGVLLGRAGIPAFNVWLTAEIPERARRVAVREGIQTSKVLEEMRGREESERRRYLSLYRFDTFEGSALDELFDLVIDTTPIPAARVADMVVDGYRGWSNAG